MYTKLLLECSHLPSILHLQEDGISSFEACHLHGHLRKLSASPGAQHTMQLIIIRGEGVCKPIYPVKSVSLDCLLSSRDLLRVTDNQLFKLSGSLNILN